MRCYTACRSDVIEAKEAAKAAQELKKKKKQFQQQKQYASSFYHCLPPECSVIISPHCTETLLEFVLKVTIHSCCNKCSSNRHI